MSCCQVDPNSPAGLRARAEAIAKVRSIDYTKRSERINWLVNEANRIEREQKIVWSEFDRVLKGLLSRRGSYYDNMPINTREISLWSDLKAFIAKVESKNS